MRRLAPLVLTVAVSCGDDTSAAPTTGDGTSSSAEGSPTTAITTEGGESSGSTDDGADTSTTAEASSSSDTRSGNPLACEVGETRLVGELDDMAIDEMPFGMGVAATSLGVRIGIGDLGRVHLRADVDHIEAPEPLFGSGYLRMPADGPLPEQWYCFDATSSYQTLGESSYVASLEGLRGLGACPGEPVLGTASVCFGAASCGGERTFVSEVEGATFTTPLGSVGSGGGAIGATDVDIEHDLGESEGGALYLHATSVDYDSTGPQQSAVDVVYFIVPLGEQDGGAVYCAELDATLDYEMMRGFPEPLSAEIANISRLGACGDRPGAGHLDLCMNFGG